MRRAPNSAPHLVIMAAGTGGHIMPGLAVAREVRARGWTVSWLGTSHGMENRLVPPAGIEMDTIAFSGLRGKGLLHTATGGLRLLKAFWDCLRILRRRQADAVLGMGGYVAFPGGMMASLLARPLAVHEQNAIAGLTNRVLAGVADRKLAAFPAALAGADWTGNPVRAEIAALAAPEARYAGRTGPLRLLVVGGSLGAQALNDALPRALALFAQADRPVVTHQAGERHLDALRRNYAQAGVDGELVAFIEDMGRRYAEADLVICRAGAMTVSELAAAGVPGVLVPFPHAVDDHQTANARFLSDRGAAVLLPQADLSPEGLAALLRTLDRASLLAMAQKARALGKPDATRVVAEHCVAMAGAR